MLCEFHLNYKKRNKIRIVYNREWGARWQDNSGTFWIPLLFPFLDLCTDFKRGSLFENHWAIRFLFQIYVCTGIYLK